MTRLLRLPDSWLNQISMYRLVVYYLGGLLGIAVIQSALGRLDYPISALVGTTAVAVLASVAINALFASVFGAPLNNDSAVITGLILALITGPAMTRGDIMERQDEKLIKRGWMQHAKAVELLTFQC